jgi:hypothetical protein
LISHFALCSESAKAYDKINAGDDYDFEDKLNQLVDLFKKTKDLIGAGENTQISNIIENKETESYDKAINTLILKLPKNESN